MKKIEFITVLVIVLQLCFTAFADSAVDYYEDDYYEDTNEGITLNRFTDVPEDSYYYDPVNWALEQNITSGTSETTFSPNQTCTRGQVVTFLWRALGCPEPEMEDNIFSDVNKDDYYYKPILWAYENYITNGTSVTTFGPKEICTSGQVITFLWRAMGEPDSDISLLPSSDRSQYYAGAVAWAIENDILNHSTNKFVAGDLSPRADIVTYLYYVLN